MKKILVTDGDLNKICRLCLSSDATVIDIFCFSARLKDQPSNVIMKCAPVHITCPDEMPKFICRLCYTQLENFHQFQLRVVQSDETLRLYLQQLHASDKQTKSSYSVQRLSENSLNHNTNKNITVKCENLEFRNTCDVKEEESENLNSETKTEMFLKSEIKDEPIDDDSLISTENTLSRDVVDQISCASSYININDPKMDVNWKENGHFFSVNEVNEKLLLKSETNDESTAYNSIFITEHVDNTGIASSNGDGSENTNIDIGHTSKITEKNEDGQKTNSKLYQCNICDICFTQIEDFKKHIPLHFGQKTFKCDICNKSYTRASNLITHKRSHTGEKPYQCNFCNKCFAQSSTLNSHKFTHTGEKPYQCDVCNENFSRMSKLKVHKRAHTGEKPYQCDVCNKNFSYLSKLKIHKRMHTGEKPYQCDVCNKCFSQSTKVKIHKRTHTGEKPYQCDVCSKCFARVDYLNIHKLQHLSRKSNN